MVHASPSSQVVGQAYICPGGMPTSHASVMSRTPSPHAGRQSMSIARVAPGGQQLSGRSSIAVTVGTHVHTAEQVFCEITTPRAHVIGMQSAVIGQAPSLPRGIPVSQVSPLSTTPLPQVFKQSLSADGPSLL